ncbi:hypothetical protein Lalb_Chr03g0032641 [Lupinus albus]|uniref:Uncharacterized protein n=1 Tax=Lupinus albus TaxID=3870 RepID=A0A6A4QWC8_LUPAL|nr:hypothetical protein Lalb_Chr03g0032641 [Lupinus albus]
MMDRSIGIQSYHFSMSQEGPWRIERICYTYTGLVLLISVPV